MIDFLLECLTVPHILLITKQGIFKIVCQVSEVIVIPILQMKETTTTEAQIDL